LHTVDQAKSNSCPGGAGSCKAPIVGETVKVFDRNSADFRNLVGTLEPSNPDRKNPTGASYDDIYEAATSPGLVGSCITDNLGICYAGESRTGDLLVIARFTDSITGATRYVGLPKSPGDFVDTTIDTDTLPDLAVKDLNVVKVIPKNCAPTNPSCVQYRGGSKTVILGSMLEIVHPTDVQWTDHEELYPFIMTSDSQWTVNVCMQVPEGYQIAGVLDENGDAVTNGAADCTQTFVTGETKVAVFSVIRTDSPEPNFVVAVTAIEPDGTSQSVNIPITGSKLETQQEQEQRAGPVLERLEREQAKIQAQQEAAAARPAGMPALPGVPSSATTAVLVLIALAIVAYGLRERAKHKKFGRHI